MLVWVGKNVATIDDVHASGKIRDEFSAAIMKIAITNQLRVSSSPRHKSTHLYIFGNLSTNEEQALQAIAMKISQNNSNRPITVEFKKEIQQGTNN
jgi:hypothetical protein